MSLFIKIPQLMLVELEFTFKKIYALRNFLTLSFMIVKVYELKSNFQILAIHMGIIYRHPTKNIKGFTRIPKSHSF